MLELICSVADFGACFLACLASVVVVGVVGAGVVFVVRAGTAYVARI